MFVVGLTGGIGSGKSTVAALFAKLGVPVIDADLVARDITQAGKPAFHEIIQHFSHYNLIKNGALDRAKLRQIIFQDDIARLWLENILHPLIRKEIERQLHHFQAPYSIVVIPLLFEVKPYSFINRILVVDAPEHVQIERASTRDKTTRNHIESIIKTQIGREDRNARAHDVILNDGKLVDLEPRVQKMHAMYLELSKSTNQS